MNRQQIIKVEAIQQSIDGQTYLILEHHQEWREQIHALSLTPVSLEPKQIIGTADDVILLQAGDAGEFPVNLNPDIDHGYIPLGLLDEDYILDVDTRGLHGATKLPEQTARIAVFEWLLNKPEWVQQQAQVVYA